MKRRYSVEAGEKDAKAMVREARISTKHAVEIARAIKGMRLGKAVEYLKDVVRKRAWVPFRRYKKKVAHRRGTMWGWKVGRYPVKAAKVFLKLLENVRANAENKGLDPEKLRIKHVSASYGRRVRYMQTREGGRNRVVRRKATNIEVVVGE